MAIKLVAITANTYKFSKEVFVRQVIEKHIEEIEPMIQGHAQSYLKNLQLKVAEFVRKELTVYEQEGESEHFIPDSIVENGVFYAFQRNVRIEGENIALYATYDDLASLYASSVINELKRYLVNRGIKLI